MKKLLIANRAEIAVRIGQTARELGYRIIGIHPEDDAMCAHVLQADETVLLPGSGAAAYLDIEAVIEAAKSSGATAIHPGYGFLSENTAFAEAVEAAGISFVGPTPEQLSRFGNKAGARSLAAELDVPLVPGTFLDTTCDDVIAFWDQHPDSGIVIKAISGGGGRGMRIVHNRDEIQNLYERCRSEAQLAFGNDAVYVERLIRRARHIEVQVLGDGKGNVIHFWERDCSSQRQNQKIVEIAPSPNLPSATRDALLSQATRMAEHANYRGLGTFEFLVDADIPSDYYFIEANARLQVEHTVTEAITGVDLVALQLAVSEGQSLPDLNLSAPPKYQGFAIQTRINMETPGKKGLFKPTGGTLTVFEAPGGPGLRLDSMGYAGYQTSTRYDSLLAKLIVHSNGPEFGTCVAKTLRALSRFRIEGFKVNLPFLQALLDEPDFSAGEITTRYIDENLSRLAERSQTNNEAETKTGLAGTQINSKDPLAVLALGKSDAAIDPDLNTSATLNSMVDGPDGAIAARAPLQGTITELLVGEGDLVFEGQEIAVMDAMKMEHVVQAPLAGEVVLITVEPNDTILEEHPIVFIEARAVSEGDKGQAAEKDLDYIRPDLEEAMTRHGYKLDANREAAVARRRKTNHRTVRENIDDICDPDTFVEYGSLAIAAQRRRRTVQDLMENTPGDGMVTGIGSVNGELFPDQDTQCIVMSYDYMVLAGTQGLQNHRKKDRMFEVAEQLQIPIILIAEGGGGRPGDTDGAGIAGLDCLAFQLYGKLSGLVPRIGITTGRCFAGNAVLLGTSDVVIATEDSNIGIGGPAMIEGGGLGIFKPEEVGPMDVQVPNGVVDIAVKDEAQAMAAAKKMLSYFQGPTTDWTCQDQRELRFAVPENRLRVYDMREIIATIADDDSVLELREKFGIGIITVLPESKVGLLASLQIIRSTSPARLIQTPPTKLHDSFSCVTRLISPSSLWWTALASWWVRKSRKQRWLDTLRACLSSVPASQYP